jgi:hypothetical protein
MTMAKLTPLTVHIINNSGDRKPRIHMSTALIAAIPCLGIVALFVSIIRYIGGF